MNVCIIYNKKYCNFLDSIFYHCKLVLKNQFGGNNKVFRCIVNKISHVALQIKAIEYHFPVLSFHLNFGFYFRTCELLAPLGQPM